jgi:hypothetical protein
VEVVEVLPQSAVQEMPGVAAVVDLMVEMVETHLIL